MINEKVDVLIGRRKITVEMEGLTELELISLAQMVSDRMAEIEKESKVVDSSKLAILTALDIAAENQRLKDQLENLRLVEERKVEGMIVQLEKALGPGKP